MATRRRQQVTHEEITPPSAWTEDSNAHYLIIDLPGFKKDWLKLYVDDQGNIVVTGDKPDISNKITRFQQRFKVPANSEIEKISGKLEGEVLYVTVPKQVKEEKTTRRDEIEEKREHLREAEEARDRETTDFVEKKPDHQAINGVEKKPDRKAINGVEIKPDRQVINGVEKKPEHRGEHGYQENRLDREEGFQKPSILENAVQIMRNNKGIVITAVLAFSLGVYLSQRLQSNAGSGDITSV
ncbi:hypothetical protein NMG60_11009586 [Bertholletia excelsa]